MTAMAALAGYAASAWSSVGGREQATFAATAGVWALALVALALGARRGRPTLVVASVVLFALTLAGEAATFVLVTLSLGS
jgi:hypothetical protein